MNTNSSAGGEGGSNITNSTLSKRSTYSYSTEEWRNKRSLITKLYFEEGKTLKEVRSILERDHDFKPTERMYKSRLHQWGLDKKKKEHEMLELVRAGLQRKPGEKEPVFNIRGRQVSLGDALHYFNRKGVKDPATLLTQHHHASSAEPSSPPADDTRTSDNGQFSRTLSTDPDDDESIVDAATLADEGSPLEPFDVTTRPKVFLTSSSNYARDLIGTLMQHLGISDLGTLVPFRMLSHEQLAVPRSSSSPVEMKCKQALLHQTSIYYQRVFAQRNLSADNSSWTATSDDSASDKFYTDMYHGYSFLWNQQHELAFKSFDHALSQIEELLRGHSVAFLMYIYDLVLRYDGTGQEEPLMRLLGCLASAALSVFEDDQHPIRLIALWLTEAKEIRSSLAEFALRKMLGFFQDSIGYFHPETMALLQLVASGLMNQSKYSEAAIRYQQLLDAFQTTYGHNSYEACYALRSASEAYFHQERYKEALQAIKPQ